MNLYLHLLLTTISYGLTGQEMISSILRNKTFSPWGDIEPILRRTLQRLLAHVTLCGMALPADDQFWLASAGDQIPLQDFFDYIAVPHTINLLICYDFPSIEHADADKIRLESSEYGQLFNDDTALADKIVEDSGCLQPVCSFLFLYINSADYN